MPVTIRPMTQDEMPAIANLRGATRVGPWTLTIIDAGIPGTITAPHMDGADQTAAEQWARSAIDALGYCVDQWQRNRPHDEQVISRSVLYAAP